MKNNTILGQNFSEVLVGGIILAFLIATSIVLLDTYHGLFIRILIAILRGIIFTVFYIVGLWIMARSCKF